MARVKWTSRALDKRTTRRPRQKAERARRSNRASSSSSSSQSTDAEPPTDQSIGVESTEDNEAGIDENNYGGREDDEDAEETDDTGQMGNASVALQQLQTLMKRTGKKEGFEGRFKKKIREEEQRLLRLLEEEKKGRRAEAEKFQSRFASILAMALSPPGTRRAPTHSGKIQADISPESHPLHVRSQAILKNSETIANEYKRLVEYASNVEGPPALSSTWEKDYTEIKRLADLGHEASETEIKSLLVYNGEEESRRAKWRRKTQREKLKDDAHLQEMLEIGRETLSERERSREVRGWQVVAHKAQKGLEAMVKAWPDADEKLCSVDESQ